MLVLKRKPKESIIIGDEVEITVVEIKGNNVKLAISAPRSIPVHRKEIYEEIKNENLAASQTDQQSLKLLNKIFSLEKSLNKKG